MARPGSWNSGWRSSWVCPVVNTWFLALRSITSPAYSTARDSGMNSSGGSWPVRAISFSPMPSGPVSVKWVLSRLASAESCSASTGRSVRSSRLFTRLSAVITTAIKLPVSTGSRSKRRTVTPPLPTAAA